jgi:AraC-like DNA-binding protein
VLDREIASRVAVARPLNARAEWAWETLIRTDGRAPIDNVRRETGWSERHFAASFRQEFGLTPKTFANVLRFGRAALLLSGGSLPSLTEVALACGYFDQAHFNRDFQSGRHANGRNVADTASSRRPRQRLKSSRRRACPTAFHAGRMATLGLTRAARRLGK